jgi:hypothetical protein
MIVCEGQGTLAAFTQRTRRCKQACYCVLKRRHIASRRYQAAAIERDQFRRARAVADN